MRTFLDVLFVIIFLIVSLPVMGVEFIISKFSKHHADMIQLRFVQFGFKFIMFLSGVHLTVEGRENIPQDKAVLYIGNHRGFFDVVAAYSQCPNPTGFIAKKSIGKIPVLSLLMRRIYCLLIDRSDIRQNMKVILTAIEYAKSDVSICIFPEGTRNKDADVTKTLPFKEGSFKIAQKAKCPVVPMAIMGADEVLENHFPWVKRTNMTIKYGTPFYIEDLPKEKQKKAGAYTQAIIEDMLKDLATRNSEK